MRIAVASQMFHGLLLVYRDSVVKNPDVFAQQALTLADSLLDRDAGRASTRSDGSPSQASATRAQEDIDLAKLIVAQNDALLCAIRSRRGGKASTGQSPTIH